MLLDRGVDVNKWIIDNGCTPLYIASGNGHSEVVRQLLNAMADVGLARIDNGESPLYRATEKG